MNEYAILCYRYLIIYAVSIALGWLTSQCLKTFLNMRKNKNRSFEYFVKCFFSNGSFPSTHTSSETTLSVTIILTLFNLINNSTSTSEALILSSLIAFLAYKLMQTMVDAVGVRYELEKSNMEVKKISKAFEKITIIWGNLLETATDVTFIPPVGKNEYKDTSDKLKENVGHTPSEVFGGILMGILNAFCVFFLINKNYIGLFAFLGLYAAYIIVSSLGVLYPEKTIKVLKSITKAFHKSR